MTRTSWWSQAIGRHRPSGWGVGVQPGRAPRGSNRRRAVACPLPARPQHQRRDRLRLEHQPPRPSVPPRARAVRKQYLALVRGSFQGGSITPSRHRGRRVEAQTDLRCLAKPPPARVRPAWCWRNRSQVGPIRSASPQAPQSPDRQGRQLQQGALVEPLGQPTNCIDWRCTPGGRLTHPSTGASLRFTAPLPET